MSNYIDTLNAAVDLEIAARDLVAMLREYPRARSKGAAIRALMEQVDAVERDHRAFIEGWEDWAKG